MGFYKPRPTLAELYDENPNILAGFHVPTGLSIETNVHNIIVQLGDLQTICDTAYDLSIAVALWSDGWIDQWERLYLAMIASYDPLKNYDRTDTETETVGIEGQSSFTGSTEASGTDTVTRKRQGFNSTDFVPADQDSTTLGTKNDSSSETGTTSSTERSKTLRSTGNIGVTTSQQMLESEIKLRAASNMYQIMLETFKREICVGVW